VKSNSENKFKMDKKKIDDDLNLKKSKKAKTIKKKVRPPRTLWVRRKKKN
jgi:hypothetical protein